MKTFCHRDRRCAAGALALALLAGATAAPAQSVTPAPAAQSSAPAQATAPATRPATTRPAPAATRPDAATAIATTPYADYAFGFEMQLPAGWNFDRTRFREWEGSIGLLRGRNPSGRQSLQIVIFRNFELPPFPEWLTRFEQDLVKLSEMKVADRFPLDLGKRLGAVLELDGGTGAAAIKTFHLCVPFDANTVWVFAYAGATQNDDELRALRAQFDQLAGSLHVLYDPQDAERLAADFERGRALLEKLRASAAALQLGGERGLDDKERCYEIRLAGEPVGYLTRQITREEHVFSQPGARKRSAKEGIRIRETSWRFAEDGAVRYTQLDLFSSFDLRSELIETRQFFVPPPGQAPAGAGQPGAAAPPKLLIRTDQCVREDEVLFSSSRTNLDRGLPDPQRPVNVGPVYLDWAWQRLLPALLLTAPHEAHAVAVFDADTRAVITHSVRPLGSQDLPAPGVGAGRATRAYAFEIRDGFVDQPRLLYTDERGNVLRIDAGDLSVGLTPKEELEKKFGPRQREAEQRMKGGG